MDYIIVAGVALIAVLLAVVLVQLASLRRRQEDSTQIRALQERVDRLQQELAAELRASRQESTQIIQQSVQSLSQVLLTAQGQANQQMTDSMENIRKAVTGQLDTIRQENTHQLEQMRLTVDEKLQQTLNDRISQSFRLVNERLEQVYTGLGEMKTLASGVGDLKKVLSNVKTRGVLGEIQLGAILEQILSPDQYEANVKVKPGSTNVVEFAVKLPGSDSGHVWLPIDAKFPVDAYGQLLDAYDAGDPDGIKAAGSVLEQRIRSFAKDIRDKYIDPPHTTDFGIMFLPVEGLYAEVVRRGMIEVLQRDYHVNIAGPTTMAAVLNSLQMGFKTLAIQKRSGEVWKVLGAVKTEFDKFGVVIQSAQQRLEQANSELDKLVGVRTRQIQRRLADVTSLPEGEATGLLEGTVSADTEE
ncbi:MAG: DNA recombination protein RmuC [Ruminococcaceae bacterium]|nr:DNA recombination protein RmuC [Oscillospiraceae bacterium]